MSYAYCLKVAIIRECDHSNMLCSWCGRRDSVAIQIESVCVRMENEVKQSNLVARSTNPPSDIPREFDST